MSFAGLLTRIIISITVLAILAFSFIYTSDSNRHFIYLADALNRGSFSVDRLPTNYIDKIQVDGKTYLPLAPMPAILEMPLVAVFGIEFREKILSYFFTGLSALCMLVILKRLGIPSHQHKSQLVLFIFGTVYLCSLMIGQSWFLSHVLTVTFLFLAIAETLTKRRAWLVGVWLGLAFLTRASSILSLPFFVWMLKPSVVTWFKPRGWLSLGAQFGLGLAVPFLFFMYYNYVRFGNPFETGYAQAVLASPTLVAARSYGLFSLVHLPKNLYAFLLAGPQAYPSLSAPVLEFPYIYPSPWGMGIFFTTPAFVYIFAANWRERLVRAAWVAIALVAIPLLTYYGVGWTQFGYRYALDFYPFLFLLAVQGLARNFDGRARVLITLGVLINIWGALWQMLGFGLAPLQLMR